MKALWKTLKVYLKKKLVFQNLKKGHLLLEKKSKLLTKLKKFKRNLSGSGRKLYTAEIENNLIEFIKKCREIEIAISTHELIIEAQRLFPPIINN